MLSSLVALLKSFRHPNASFHEWTALAVQTLVDWHDALAGALTHHNGVSLCKGAPLNVLPGEPDVPALGHQRAKGQPFGHGEINTWPSIRRRPTHGVEPLFEEVVHVLVKLGLSRYVVQASGDHLQTLFVQAGLSVTEHQRHQRPADDTLARAPSYLCTGTPAWPAFNSGAAEWLGSSALCMAVVV